MVLNLTDFQFSTLVRMLITSSYCHDLEACSSLVNYVRSVNPDLFDNVYLCS